MSEFSNIKTDAQIAHILKKLKEFSSTDKPKKSEPVKESDSDEVEVEVSKVPVESLDSVTKSQTDDTPKYILPWFSPGDKDSEFIHYVKLDTNGNLAYDKVRYDASTSSLAALKLQKNYLCEIDYYKSKHYVLSVKLIDSDYNVSRSDVAASGNEDIEVDETTFIDGNEATVTESYSPCDNCLTKEATEDAISKVMDLPEYKHFVVFTDLGVVDFIASNNDIEYPYTTDNLSKWFEETSNHIQIKQPRYVENEDLDSSIKDFKYDLITMHVPGIISLDSSDNDKSDYNLTLKIKDEYSFIPLSRILGCLKYYSTSNLKSIDDFRRFVCKYFDVIK